ncbi:(2Fe-2S)-binding protein [Sphingomonas bacterium]|uniref:(2Fe-2S)-binding protein n=1 Tax=Sphingomonas bacterium TaxID=1895847 RepID=UPI0015755C22|nr:(2Fe-2S)-binding protein [Sphingomonas bacterium]
MSSRIERGVTRGRGIWLRVDGHVVEAYAGETVASAMLAAGFIAFRRGATGNPHGMFCNMGTCSECFVAVRRAGSEAVRRLRACLVAAEDAMVVETGTGADD